LDETAAEAALKIPKVAEIITPREAEEENIV